VWDLLFVGTCVYDPYGDDDFGVDFRSVARSINIPSPRHQKLLQTRYNISLTGRLIRGGRNGLIARDWLGL
jgi:hypothetical protein